jgi:high-affinity nickel-transport protein
LPDALLLAVCFMFGMMVTDAVNGLWISHLLRRADETARTASRIMDITAWQCSVLPWRD